MGNEMVGVSHIRLRLQLRELLQAHQHLAFVLRQIHQIEARALWNIHLKISLIVANGIAIAWHQALQAAIAEGGGPMPICTHAVDGPAYNLTLVCSDIVDSGVQPVILARIIYKVGIIDPLQTATLVVVPSLRLTHMVPLTVVFPGIIAHLEDIVLRRHTEGNRETAGQQAAIVATKGLHVVEAEEAVSQHDGFLLEPRRIIGQQVVEALIDITDEILQDIVVLDSLIDKCL